MEEQKNMEDHQILKTIDELLNELQTNEKILEQALENFKGNEVRINTFMNSSVNSSFCIDNLDWTYIVGHNDQIYFYISEYPYEAIAEPSLILNIDNIAEVDLNNNTLKILFNDNFSLHINCISL